LFDPTNGVEVFGLDSSSDGASSTIVGGLPPTAGGVLVSTTGGIESLTEISSATLSLSMWKLNSPKDMSKPPVTVEAAPAKPEVGSMMVVAGVRAAALGDAVSMTVDTAMSTLASDGLVSMMAGTAMPTAVMMVGSMSILLLASKLMAESMSSGDAESTAMADDGPSNLVDAVRLSMVGEGAGESIDPDPVVPTVGAN
jgi:hypothetical protein